MLENFIKEIPIYNVEENGISPVVKFDDSQCDSYPQTYTLNNHYVCGKLIVLDKLKQPLKIKDFNTILVFKKFKEEYIPYLRQCKGAISRDDDTKSEFYTFCSGLGMSFICNIKDNKMYDFICTLHNKNVTFDPVGQMIYSGLRKVIRYNSIDDIDLKKFVFNNNLLKIIERYNLENQIDDKVRKLPFYGMVITNRDIVDIIKDKGEETKSEYTLPYLIPESMSDKFDIYINDERLTKKQYQIKNYSDLIIDKNVVITNQDIIKLIRNNATIAKDLNLIKNYSMTKTDERNYYTEKKYIKVDIPEDIEQDSIICCSYNGLMNKDIDFIIDNNKIVFNIEPMRDRVIQIFGFRKERVRKN